MCEAEVHHAIAIVISCGVIKGAGSNNGFEAGAIGADGSVHIPKYYDDIMARNTSKLNSELLTKGVLGIYRDKHSMRISNKEGEESMRMVKENK